MCVCGGGIYHISGLVNDDTDTETTMMSLDSTGSHGSRNTHPLSLHSIGDSPIGGHALLVNQELRLNLFKHFLLRV